MKHYDFPQIDRIEDVLPHIEGRTEFRVAERDHGIRVIDYVVSESETFPNISSDMSEGDFRTAAMRRECRGLIFDSDGGILSRRFSKFFNMGEKVETQPENIDFSIPHHLLDKEDGSMVSPVMNSERHLFWATRMGETDVSKNAASFIENSLYRYEDLARYCIELGQTPIFEWCDKRINIVIRHKASKLILLAVRDNVSGRYLPYEEVERLANDFKIPVVRSFGTIKDSPQEFLEKVRGEEDIEGYVVQFDSGHRVKMKTEWYCSIHKTKDGLSHEKDVWKMILNENVDDLLPFLDETDKDKVLQFQDNFLKAVKDAEGILYEHVSKIMDKSNGDRKTFALAVKDNPALVNYQGMAFRLFDTDRDQWGDKIPQLVRGFAMNSTKSRTTVENARKVIKVDSWHPISYVE